MMSKSSGANEISFNVIKNCFGELSNIFRYILIYFCKQGYFRILLRLRKSPPLSKPGSLEEISNQRPISVLACLSNTLELIIHNFMATYLTKKYYIPNSSAFKKVIPWTMPRINKLTKFIKHLKTKLTHLIFLLIYKRPLTLFDHSILLKKLENYVTKHTNLA